MSSYLTPIDISHNPELSRIAERVEAAEKPLALTKDKKTIAVIMPVNKAKQQQARTDYAGILKTFGTWKDVDTKKLKEAVYTARQRTNTRPPVKL
jgi:hypothetical protein